jgi:hypothetical protein
MLHHQKEPDRVREMHEHRVLQQTQQSAPSEDIYDTTLIAQKLYFYV